MDIIFDTGADGVTIVVLGGVTLKSATSVDLSWSKNGNRTNVKIKATSEADKKAIKAFESGKETGRVFGIGSVEPTEGASVGTAKGKADLADDGDEA